MLRFGQLFCVVAIFGSAALPAAGPPRANGGKLAVLLLGDDGHHRPELMARVVTPPLAKAGIRVDFTKDVRAFNAATLARYDAVLIYRDSGSLPEAQEKALLDF